MVRKLQFLDVLLLRPIVAHDFKENFIVSCSVSQEALTNAVRASWDTEGEAMNICLKSCF